MTLSVLLGMEDSHPDLVLYSLGFILLHALISVGFGWLVDEVVWACAIVVLSVDVDI